jgi:hypothetical protein
MPAIVADAPPIEPETSVDTWIVLMVFVSFVCSLVNAFSSSLPLRQRLLTGGVTLAITLVPVAQLAVSIGSKYRLWRGTGEGIIIHDWPGPHTTEPGPSTTSS